MTLQNFGERIYFNFDSNFTASLFPGSIGNKPTLAQVILLGAAWNNVDQYVRRQ